jgi:hypothetical protein
VTGGAAAAEEAGERDLAGGFPPAHQAGNLINLHQPIHAGAKAELIAMLLGTEVSIATYT